MKKSQIKQGVLLSQAALMVETIVGIIYTPILLRLLGQSEYGLYTLMVSTTNYLNLLSLGFTSSYLRFFCQYKADEGEDKVAQLNGTYFYIFITMGLVALAVGHLVLFFYNDIFGGALSDMELKRGRILMTMMVYNIGLKFPMSVFSTYINVNERFVFLKLTKLIQTILFPFVVIGVLSMGYKSIALLSITLVSNVIVHGLNVYYSVVKMKMKVNMRRFRPAMVKELSAFSVFVFINMLVNEINLNVDKFLLGKMKGTDAVAVYGIASKLNIYYLSISMSFSGVLTPRVHHMVAQSEDKGKVTEFLVKAGRLQFMVLALLAMGYLVFGKAFIRIWVGPAYDEAFYVLLILMLALLIPSVQNLCYEVQKAMNKLKPRSLMHLAMSVMNVGISIPLIYYYGPTGAAVGTGVAILIVDILVMNVYYHRALSLDMVFYWRKILGLVPAMVIPAVLGVFIARNVALEQPLLFVLWGIIFVAVYGLCLMLMGMNPYEKGLVMKPVLKLKEKYWP